MTLDTLSDAALMYQRQGEYAMAEAYAAQSLAGRRHNAGKPGHDGGGVRPGAGLLSEGKFSKSEPLAREVAETDRKTRPDDWHRFRAESLLGASLAGQKKYSEAEPWLLEGYRGMVARGNQMELGESYHLDRAREWLVQLYEAWGQPAKAVEFRKK